MSWPGRVLNLFRRRRLDADIEEELQFHLEARTRDNVAAGMTPDDARRDARRRFGSPLYAREASRDANVVLWLETLILDLRYAVRGLRKSPAVTAIAVLSLGLAIGANTAIFSLLNAVLLKPLPYRDAGRIAILWTTNTLNGAREQNTSVPNLRDWKAQSRTFEDLAAYRESDGLLADPGDPTRETEWTGYAWVTGNFFSLLGRPPALGRAIGADDLAGRSHVAVIGHRLWKRRFAGSADAIGKTLSIGGFNVEIVGVTPEDFHFPTHDVELWLPESVSPRWQAAHADRATRFGVVFGRLGGAATLEQARAEMKIIAGELERQHPVANANLGINIVPLHLQLTGTSVRFMLALLGGAVTFVLLIASANVANLLLARGLARRREFAVRTALGAGRRRILRQLLTESVLLSCLGGALGLALVAWTIRTFVAFAPRNLARLDDVHIDGAVLVFTFSVSVLTGLLFGLAPAIRISRAGSSESLHAISRPVAGGRNVRALRGGFVVCQFALAVVLLAGAGLLVRSLLAIRAVDSGFGDRGVTTARLRLNTALPRAQRAALYKNAIERIGAVPGVRSAGAIATMFWDGESAKFGLRAVDGRPPETREQWSELTWTTVGGDYFQTIGVPLVSGRFFQDADRRGSPPVVLVNETMARRYWPGDNPVGQRIKGFDARGTNDEWVTVIGVVKDVRSRGLERTPMAQIFEAQAQSLDETESLVVSAAAPQGLFDAVRNAIRDVDRTAVLSDVSTLDRTLAEQSAQRQFQTYLLTAFAALALALAGAGIFGVMHYSVVQRTQEIGIRMALGARRRNVLGMVLREGLALAALGVVCGAAGSIALMRTISSLLFGVTPADPLTFAVVSVTLTAIAIVGCCLPALRAARVDPLLALRSE